MLPSSADGMWFGVIQRGRRDTRHVHSSGRVVDREVKRSDPGLVAIGDVDRARSLLPALRRSAALLGCDAAFAPTA